MSSSPSNATGCSQNPSKTTPARNANPASETASAAATSRGSTRSRSKAPRSGRARASTSISSKTGSSWKNPTGSSRWNCSPSTTKPELDHLFLININTRSLPFLRLQKALIRQIKNLEHPLPRGGRALDVPAVRVAIHPTPDLLHPDLPALQVAFIPHHDHRHALSLDSAIQLLHPVIQLLEGAAVSEVENQKDDVSVPIVSCYGMRTERPLSGTSTSLQCPKYFG